MWNTIAVNLLPWVNYSIDSDPDSPSTQRKRGREALKLALEKNDRTRPNTFFLFTTPELHLIVVIMLWSSLRLQNHAVFQVQRQSLLRVTNGLGPPRFPLSLHFISRSRNRTHSSWKRHLRTVSSSACTRRRFNFVALGRQRFGWQLFRAPKGIGSREQTKSTQLPRSPPQLEEEHI